MNGAVPLPPAQSTGTGMYGTLHAGHMPPPPLPPPPAPAPQQWVQYGQHFVQQQWAEPAQAPQDEDEGEEYDEAEYEVDQEAIDAGLAQSDVGTDPALLRDHM